MLPCQILFFRFPCHIKQKESSADWIDTCAFATQPPPIIRFKVGHAGEEVLPKLQTCMIVGSFYENQVSPLQTAGINAGDAIVRVNGASFDSLRSFAKLIKKQTDLSFDVVSHWQWHWQWQG